MRYLVFILLIISLWALTTAATDSNHNDSTTADNNTLLQQVLLQLGQPQRGDNVARPAPEASAELGEKIVLEGLLTDNKRQSKHFVCTSCHNVVKEDPNLLAADPEARLSYAIEHDLPFLAGTTLYGAVNRVSYYNGDYEKKYGDLVKPARKDLRAAIQLCATECAQGSALDNTEMESVVAYLQTIGLKLGDLELTEAEIKRVNDALANRADRAATIAMLNSKFLHYSPATFVLPPKDRKKGYPVKGDADIGAQIYDRSCLHCHENKRYSFYNLDHSSYSYEHLLKHFSRYTRYSTYQVSRYGTSPIPGKKAYMPHYTEQRMSNQQIESLRDFLNRERAR